MSWQDMPECYFWVRAAPDTMPWWVRNQNHLGGLPLLHALTSYALDQFLRGDTRTHRIRYQSHFWQLSLSPCPGTSGTRGISKSCLCCTPWQVGYQINLWELPLSPCPGEPRTRPISDSCPCRHVAPSQVPGHPRLVPRRPAARPLHVRQLGSRPAPQRPLDAPHAPWWSSGAGRSDTWRPGRRRGDVLWRGGETYKRKRERECTRKGKMSKPEKHGWESIRFSNERMPDRFNLRNVYPTLQEGNVIVINVSLFKLNVLYRSVHYSMFLNNTLMCAYILLTEIFTV